MLVFIYIWLKWTNWGANISQAQKQNRKNQSFHLMYCVQGILWPFIQNILLEKANLKKCEMQIFHSSRFYKCWWFFSCNKIHFYLKICCFKIMLIGAFLCVMRSFGTNIAWLTKKCFCFLSLFLKYVIKPEDVRYKGWLLLRLVLCLSGYPSRLSTQLYENMWNNVIRKQSVKCISRSFKSLN